MHLLGSKEMERKNVERKGNDVQQIFPGRPKLRTLQLKC